MFTYCLFTISNYLQAQECLGGGCGSAGFQFPGGTFSAPGSAFVTVSTCTYGGDYALYTVTTGNYYEWSMCVADGGASNDAQLTLYNNAVLGTPICFSDDQCATLRPKIGWTATFTGTARVKVNRYNCITDAACKTLRWREVISCVLPANPGNPTSNSPQCPTVTLTRTGAPPAGETWYWQGTACGTSTALGSGATYAATATGTYYIRSRNNTTLCWSAGCGSVGIVINCTNYFHPTTGIAGEFVGSCEVATSNGTYYDDGGAAGDYSNNIGVDGCFPFWCPLGIYRIFCPNAAGNCITATFSLFDTEAGYDELTVTNGSTQNSPVLWSGSGAGAIGPFTGTINGCLGFRFASDGSGTRPGWAATLSMAPCAGGPNGTDNNDCSNTTLICSSVAVPGNSTGPGISAEACGGAAGCPAGGENYSNWYSVSFVTGGTFNFTIVPSVGSDDYDYAVYGPGVTCGALGNALRCSDSYLTGNTGLSGAAGDVTEDVNGDKFTAQMNVLAGQTYYIMVDEWTPTGAGYNLNLGGTATISCVPLPVKLLSFDAKYDAEKKVVNLDWVTETEINNDYFAIERSLDGIIFEQIGVVKGAGNSSFTRSYYLIDTEPYPGEINYYRLRQVDFDGNFEYSTISAVVINDPLSKFSIYPNPANESATILFHTTSNTNYRLNIYDYTAKLINSYNFKSEKGKNQIHLDLKEFSKGVYFVNLQGNGEMLKTTFVKE